MNNTKPPQHLIDTAISRIQNRGLEYMRLSETDIQRFRNHAVKTIKDYRDARDTEKNYQKMRVETITWLEANGIDCTEYKTI